MVVYIIEQFKSVQGTEIYNLCCACHRQIQIVTDKKQMKCQHCGTRACTVDLEMGAKCKVTFDAAGKEVTALIIKDVIQNILSLCGNDISKAT